VFNAQREHIQFQEEAANLALQASIPKIPGLLHVLNVLVVMKKTLRQLDVYPAILENFQSQGERANLVH